MSESPEELIAEWLRLEKEYAELGDKARQIMDASGIKDQEEEFRMLSAGYLEDGIWRPYSENPSHKLVALHQTMKIRAKQNEIEQEMKKMETRAITRGIVLPELTLVEFPRPGSIRGTDRAAPKRPETRRSAQWVFDVKQAFSLAIQAGKVIAKPYIPMLKENNVRIGFFERYNIVSSGDLAEAAKRLDEVRRLGIASEDKGQLVAENCSMWRAK
jgi:hypothetical protein